MSDDFLSRWSRRKRDPAAGREDAEPVQHEPEPAVAEPPGTDEEILAGLGLKHPEQMEAGDDFAGFLKAAVPQHLKTIALRRLWRSNPTLACLDGLNDYDTDFTGGGVPAGSLKTSYEVGRGILKRIADVADVSEEPAGPEEPEAEAEVVDTAQAAGPVETGDTVEPRAAEQEPDQPALRATRRRMVFRSGTMSHRG